MKTLVLLLMILSLSIPAFGASVGLSWDAPTTNEDGTPLTDLAGFNLYNGIVSGTYTDTVDAGNVLSYQWQLGDQEGNTLYFNVTAYDSSGNESIYNGEISLTFPMVAPSPPTGLTGVVQ